MAIFSGRTGMGQRSHSVYFCIVFCGAFYPVLEPQAWIFSVDKPQT